MPASRCRRPSLLLARWHLCSGRFAAERLRVADQFRILLHDVQIEHDQQFLAAVLVDHVFLQLHDRVHDESLLGDQLGEGWERGQVGVRGPGLRLGYTTHVAVLGCQHPNHRLVPIRQRQPEAIVVGRHRFQ